VRSICEEVYKSGAVRPARNRARSRYSRAKLLTQVYPTAAENTSFDTLDRTGWITFSLILIRNPSSCVLRLLAAYVRLRKAIETQRSEGRRGEVAHTFRNSKVDSGARTHKPRHTRSLVHRLNNRERSVPAHRLETSETRSQRRRALAYPAS